MQATESVHVLRVNVSQYSGAYSPNVFAVVDSGEAVLIDAGLPDDGSVSSRLEYLKTIGEPRVELIIVTHHHFDHAGGAHRLREATGARIAMHPEAERLLRKTLRRPSRDDGPRERYIRRETAKISVDQALADGDAIRVGRLTLRVVDTPGHSAGHICLFLEEERVLFSGDNVLGLGTTAIPPPPDGDMARYVESLKKMKALDSALICPGHGPLVHQPQRKIQELIDHRHAARGAGRWRCCARGSGRRRRWCGRSIRSWTLAWSEWRWDRCCRISTSCKTREGRRCVARRATSVVCRLARRSAPATSVA